MVCYRLACIYDIYIYIFWLCSVLVVVANEGLQGFDDHGDDEDDG